MKVSLNLAQHFSNVDLKAIPREELLKRIGAQLGAIEEVTDWAPKFEGAVIVKIVSCEKHPDADKLSVCMIDDGSDKPVQIVCGAPNVHADMFAVWLKPGVTVPNSRDTDPFVLEAREIRGVVSNGMLASAHELGISNDHTGIVEVIEEDAGRKPVPGEPLTNYFALDDLVIDCENKMFTHRPDCFGNLGVARELAGISGLKFQSPDWYLSRVESEKLKVESELQFTAKNEVAELVPRFMAVAMQNVTVKSSPIWLQALLSRVGIKPINNVVDVTNYVMHLTGQPLHAFDYDKLVARSNTPSLMPRKAKKGEKLMLLGQKEIELTGEEVVIATDKQAVGLAGVMGGAETEVDDNTKNIVIECATFDMYSVRRTSMRFGLFTDAVTRFNKGQSPLQNDRVLAYAMEQMAELAGAKQASQVFDLQGKEQRTEGRVEVTTEFINVRLGSSLSAEEVKKLLENVEFNVEQTQPSETLRVSVPFWRTDIEIPEDIVEEVGRLYGYDKLPIALPPRSAKPTPKNQLFEFKQHLRYVLKEAGANELLTYSFVHGDLLKKTGTDPEKWAHHLRNAISPELQYYRTSLLPSLLAKVHPNIKAQAGSADNIFALYEIGKAHVKGDNDKEKLPSQHERLALVVAADDKTAKAKQAGAAYYLAKKYLDLLTNGQAEVSSLENEEYPIASLYQKGRSGVAKIGDEEVAVVGEFKPEIRAALKLPEYSAGLELDITLLLEHLKPKAYEVLPAFPGTQQDLTLEVESKTELLEVQNKLLQALTPRRKEGYKLDVVPKGAFQPEASDKKRLTFTILVFHPDKTLKTEEVNVIIEDLAKVAVEQLKATKV